MNQLGAEGRDLIRTLRQQRNERQGCQGQGGQGGQGGGGLMARVAALEASVTGNDAAAQISEIADPTGTAPPQENNQLQGAGSAFGRGLRMRGRRRGRKI